MKKTATLLSACLLLSGCMKHYESYERYLVSRNLPAPTMKAFPHCSDYDCATVQIANYWPKEWKQVQKQFKPKAKSAKKERQQIARAIQKMEQIIGPITHTDGDVGDTFKKTGKGQLDCVDESTNTSISLDLLRQDGLLKFHELGAPESRAPFLKWPHQTATIVEKETGVRYAVDSWFTDNGGEVYVLPLDEWKDGWKPGEEQDANSNAP